MYGVTPPLLTEDDPESDSNVTIDPNSKMDSADSDVTIDPDIIADSQLSRQTTHNWYSDSSENDWWLLLCTSLCLLSLHTPLCLLFFNRYI